MGDISRNALTIGTATITIKVVQVSGHKMTKATFRQITYINHNAIPDGAEVLGYIRDDSLYLLVTYDGKLFKAGHGHFNGGEIGMSIDNEWKSKYQQLFIAT